MTSFVHFQVLAPTASQASTSDEETLPQKKSRKRVGVDQAVVLQHAFQDNPHPARETRTQLASELGMELRAVNHWFQNKRQAVKRRGKIQSAKEEREEMQEKQERPEKPEKPAPVSQQRPLRAEATWPVAQSQQAGSSKVTTTKPLRQRVSLNNFLNTSNRPVERRTSLWDYMLSSPPQPQPSSHEPPSRGRLSPSLPRHPPKKKQRSLEWACAHSQLVESDVEADLVDTDVEDDGRSEAATDVNTPGTSEGRRSATNLSPITSVSDVGTAAKDDRQLPAEEMEAAMVLLDFMRR